MSVAKTEGAPRFSAAAGRSFMSRAFIAAGLPPADAEAVAELMLEADLRGVDSHGITRLPGYLQRIRAGGINARAQIRTVRESEATALIDGNNGMGHLVMRRAAQLAIAKAAKCGVGWVGARHSNHAGAAAVYAMMPLAHDMIGLYLAVANVNHMAPWGGIEPMLGTNPVAIAVPTLEEPPVVLDMATTITSFGKVKVAADRGQPLPEGQVMDREGQPLTDAARAGHGLLLPVGGYKGYGLSLVFALLGATLNGVPIGRDVPNMEDDGAPANTGQAIMALNVASFGPVEAFKRAVDKVARDLRGSRPMPGVSEVRYPGLQGQRNRIERSKSGIPIAKALAARLDKLAADLRIEPLTLL